MRELSFAEIALVSGGRPGGYQPNIVIEDDENAPPCMDVSLNWGGREYRDTICATPDAAFEFLGRFIDYLGSWFGGAANGVSAIIGAQIEVGRQTLQAGRANLEAAFANTQRQIEGVPPDPQP